MRSVCRYGFQHSPHTVEMSGGTRLCRQRSAALSRWLKRVFSESNWTSKIQRSFVRIDCPFRPQYLVKRQRKQTTRILFAQAVVAYRNALRIFTCGQQPQDWAVTQYNLGFALSEQAARTDGIKGMDLLSQAVIAYRNALQVKTRAQQPQEWAIIQNKMGHSFREQATRVEDAKKGEMLRQATLAYEAALEVYSHETFPSEHQDVRKSLQIIKTLFNDTDLRAN